MTRYTAHLYREMRLTYEGIEAETAEAAAAIARGRLTGDADDIDDCDGETFAALVDVVGDDQYGQSVMIDFEAERLRKAAPELLEALQYLLEQTVDMDQKYGIGLSEGEEDARAKALAAIAKAKAEPSERRRS
jgi:hypothetical protein